MECDCGVSAISFVAGHQKDTPGSSRLRRFCLLHEHSILERLKIIADAVDQVLYVLGADAVLQRKRLDILDPLGLQFGIVHDNLLPENHPPLPDNGMRSAGFPVSVARSRT